MTEPTMTEILTAVHAVDTKVEKVITQQESDNEAFVSLVETVKENGRTTAKTQTNIAVIKGQFGLVRWILGIIGLGTVGTIVTVAAGFVG